MSAFRQGLDRRRFLSTAGAWGASVTGAAMLPSEVLAELLASPQMTEGPFYPDRLPLDTDNDLLVINESTVHALGEITHLSGKVLSRAGEPLRNAVVEIWQADQNGAYLHSRTNNADRRDSNFQGYGRFLTDSTGRYQFRTIKPVPYPGRTPHIHVAVSQSGHRTLTTQLFVPGEAQNARDGIYQRLSAPEQELVTMRFQSVTDSPRVEHLATCDLVIGRTPAEGDDGQFPGVMARPEGDRRGGRRPRR